MADGRMRFAAVLGTVITGAGIASAAPVAAATGPVVAGLTVSPATTVVGGQVTVVATATNTTAAPVQASLGIDDYQYAAQTFTAVSGSAGCTPRNLHRLIYCGVQSLAPGATARITVSLRPTATGTDDFRSYARITYTTDDTYAYGTLTVS